MTRAELDVKLEARAADLTRTGVLGDLTSLAFTERWMDAGGWVAVMPTGSNAATLLAEPGAGVVIVDGNNRPLFSGSADLTEDGTKVAVQRTRADADGIESDVTTITGVDDFGTLRDRIAHPAPETLDASTSEADVRTGPATTVLLEYLDANAGPSAYTGRAITNLTLLADPAVGSTVTGRARFQELLELLRELATAGGAGMTLRQNGDALEAAAFATVDRSSSVVFAAELGNTARIATKATRTDATDVLVAGQGEGTARTLAWRTVPATPSRRIERFIDRRDLPTLDELNTAGDVFLDGSGGLVSIEVDPIDTATFQYGRDYFLGDVVGIRVGDAELFAARVTACTTVIKGSTLTRTLTIGIEQTRGTEALLSGVSRVGARVSSLERNGVTAPNLVALAGVDFTATTFPVFTAADVVEAKPITAAGFALVAAAAAPAQLTALGVSAAGQALIDDADVAAMRTTLGITAALLKVEIGQLLFPVGAIYAATVATNPGTLLGFGTWTAYGEGRVMVGKAAAGTFSTGGATGGAETHLLTGNESGTSVHNHTQNPHGHGLQQGPYTGGGNYTPPGSSNVYGVNAFTDSATATNNATAAANAASAHNNLQPYIVTYLWQRTA